MSKSPKQSKRYSTAAQREREGIALVGQIVTAMGHIWREKGVDHGVDGEIELVDEGVATNRVLWVQSKAQGDGNPFPGENDSGFHWRANEADLQYWTTGTAPVLLVCSHPESNEAWFRDLAAWSADPINRTSRNIQFDKVKDQFNAAAGRRLLKLGADARSGLYLRPVPRVETVVTNLLPVRRIAATVSVARSDCRRWDEANPRLVRAGLPTVSDILFKSGEILSMRVPDDPVLLTLADGPVRSVPTEEFCAGDATGPLMPWLLATTLKDLTHRDLRFDADHKYLYFRPNKDGSDRHAKSLGKRVRTVVVTKRPADDETWTTYRRHYALRHRFHQLGGRWFLSIVPTYHFTSPNGNEHPWASILLSNIKRIEGHEAIRGQTAFWAKYLTAGPHLFSGPPDPRLQFGELETTEVERGIDDPSWKPAPEEYTHAGSDTRLSLFDLADFP